METMLGISANEFWDGTPQGWRSASISIHSHWLSEDEAEAHWMSPGNIEGVSDPRWDKFLEKEQAFLGLFRTLQGEFGLRVWEEGVRCEGTLESLPGIESICRRNVRERQFDLFRVDDLSMVILGNFDLTFPVYLPTECSWSDIEALVRKAGLYLLHGS